MDRHARHTLRPHHNHHNHHLREDLSSRPYAWLRPDFVPPSPFLVIHDSSTQSSHVVVEPHLVDAEFRKALLPYFCRSGHPEVSAEKFLGFIGHFFASAKFLGSSSDHRSRLAGGC